MDKLDAIRLFHKVVECSSFAKASQAMKVAPSTVTRQINFLESTLKTTLFARSTRELSLTDAGREFLANSQSMLRLWDQSLAQTAASRVGGELRVSVVESFGRLVIAPLVGEFLEQYPELKIALHLDNQVSNLYQDGIDIAIRIGQPQDSQLRYRKLVLNRMRLWGPTSYLDREGIPEGPEDLSRHNCLLYSRQRQQSWWHCRRGEDYRKIEVQGNITSIGGTPLVSALNQGLGLVLVPRWLEADVDRSVCTPLLTDWHIDLTAQGSGEIHALFVQPTPNTRAFLDFLTDRLSLNTEA